MQGQQEQAGAQETAQEMVLELEMKQDFLEVEEWV